MPYKDKNKRKECAKQCAKRYDEKHPLEARGHYLLNNYNRMDKNAGRPKGDLTIKWIVENIFSKPCAHCGKEGWQIIGCNRLDNSKPHTKNNVEPCCEECNHKLAGEYMQDKCSKKVAQIDPISGEIVHIWTSMREADRNGFKRASVHQSKDNPFLQTHCDHRHLHLDI